MIFDGQWKRELRKLSREIAFWRKMTMFSHIAEHRLNRAILYSAIILRKIIEEEKEAKEIGIALRENAMSKEDLETFFRNQGMSDEIVRLFVEANKQPPAFATLHYMVEIMEFPYKGNEEAVSEEQLDKNPIPIEELISRKHPNPDYGVGKEKSWPLKEICHQLIHSYVWMLVCNDSGKGYSGFAVASDRKREKVLYFVPFDEWLKAIETAIEHSVI